MHHHLALPTWLLALLALLAIARVTRIVIEDAVLDRPRDWLLNHVDPEGATAYFVRCPWCVSFWVGLAVAAAVYWRPGAWWVQWPVLALAGSHVTGWIAGYEPGGDNDGSDE